MVKKRLVQVSLFESLVRLHLILLVLLLPLVALSQGTGLERHTVKHHIRHLVLKALRVELVGGVVDWKSHVEKVRDGRELVGEVSGVLQIVGAD